MSAVVGSGTELERLLVEATSLLLERARIELEREMKPGDDSAAASLRRMRECEDALRALRHEPAAAAPHSERQVSRYYEVPGQEDA